MYKEVIYSWFAGAYVGVPIGAIIADQIPSVDANVIMTATIVILSLFFGGLTYWIHRTGRNS
jgi:hypothetical protein